VPLSGNTATFSTALLSAGSHVITAIYSGDSNYQSSTAQTVNITVLPAWLGVGSAASWNTSTHILTVTGVTTITADPAGDQPVIVATSAAGQVTIAANAGTLVHLGGFQLSGGASINVQSVGIARSSVNHNVLVIGTVGATNPPTASIDSMSKLDLGDNDLIIHDGDLTNTQSLAREGLNIAGIGGIWSGTGLDSSNAAAVDSNAGSDQISLAVERNGDQASDRFGSYIVGSATEPLRSDGNDIIIKYTLTADSNLDGIVNSNDFAILAANFGKTLQAWSNGDFNYDGVVNALDFNALANNFGRPNPSASSVAEGLVGDAASAKGDLRRTANFDSKIVENSSARRAASVFDDLHNTSLFSLTTSAFSDAPILWSTPQTDEFREPWKLASNVI
jgi:hypothetical protein